MEEDVRSREDKPRGSLSLSLSLSVLPFFLLHDLFSSLKGFRAWVRACVRSPFALALVRRAVGKPKRWMKQRLVHTAEYIGAWQRNDSGGYVKHYIYIYIYTLPGRTDCRTLRPTFIRSPSWNRLINFDGAIVHYVADEVSYLYSIVPILR